MAQHLHSPGKAGRSNDARDATGTGATVHGVSLRITHIPFARAVFAAAGVLGLFILLPGFFTIDMVGRQYPPAVTHQDFYYGFLCVTVAWQLV